MLTSATERRIYLDGKGFEVGEKGVPMLWWQVWADDPLRGISIAGDVSALELNLLQLKFWGGM